MPISLKCACGALLDIDDLFAGKTIPCPDCQRPLQIVRPQVGPTKTSGLALASFLLALIGAFTVVGTLAAIVCGLLAVRQFRREPTQWAGRRFAQAGIVLGVLFTGLTVFGLLSRDLYGLDGVLRAFDYAGKLDYQGGRTVTSNGGLNAGRGFSIDRPGRSWGQFRQLATNVPEPDALILVDVLEDAHLAVMSHELRDLKETDAEAMREEAVQKFRNSQLVGLLARGRPKKEPPEPKVTLPPEEKDKAKDMDQQDFLLEVPLGGFPRTFVVRVLRDQSRILIVVGGARSARFARLETTLRKALESFKLEK